MLFWDGGFNGFAAMTTGPPGKDNVQHIHVDFGQFNDLMGIVGFQATRDYC